MRSEPNNRIRVLVVDDSVLMSRQITSILNTDEKIEVVGRAKDGVEALALVEELKPDVVTMDVEMPRMNGITALKHIMVRHALPTLMISALTTEGARTTFDALKYGAIDVIAKPSRREDVSLDAQKADIIAKVKRAAAIRTGRSRYIRMSHVAPYEPKQEWGPADDSTRLIAIGAGTGGYYGLLRIVPALPAEFRDCLVAMVLVQSRYVEPFIVYLESHSSVMVRPALDGERPQRGAAYICSYQEGLVVEHDDQGPRFVLRGEADEGCGPIDRMLTSLAPLGQRAVGVVMTGAGRDGAAGLSEIRKAGGITIAQDVNNCLDPQMPLAALELDAVDQMLPDYHMPDFFLRLGSE